MPSTYASPVSEPIRIGVIGGSGVYKLDCLQDAAYYEMDTPFGKPSAPVCVAKVGGISCAFLPRHGAHHQFNPSEVNYRANICAMKQLGVEYLLTINAVGSLDDDYQPGDLALVTQIVDQTKGKRDYTFFENGIVAHVDYAHPTSEAFTKLAYEALLDCFPDVKNGTADWHIRPSSTLVTMEGPQFSTRAESLFHKSLGAHLIGMTSATEAKLAREAEIAYATVAMVTDMDAWSDRPHVDVSAVAKVLKANVAKANIYPAAVIKALGEKLDTLGADPAHGALTFGIMTPAEHVPAATKEKLAPIIAKKYPQYAP